MPNYDSPIEFNWLGVAFTSDRLPKEVSVEVNAFMDELFESAQKRFEQWLDAHNLECVMGVIVEKGTVPKPDPQPDFIRYGNYRIYPNDDWTRFTVYHESDLGTGVASYIADSKEAAFAYIDGKPAVIKATPVANAKPTEPVKVYMPVPDNMECETHDCAFNGHGICMRDKIKGSKPRITEDDGCIDGVIDIGL